MVSQFQHFRWTYCLLLQGCSEPSLGISGCTDVVWKKATCRLWSVTATYGARGRHRGQI